MTIKTIETKIYTIEDHPEPSKVYDWIRENWHNLNQHGVDEAIESLNAFATRLDCGLDYSIGQEPNRNDYITFVNDTAHSDEVMFEPSTLKLIIEKSEACGFTGISHDYLLAESLKGWNEESALSLEDIQDLLAPVVFEAIHSETQYIYDSDSLKDLCEANEYYFNEAGEYTAA